MSRSLQELGNSGGSHFSNSSPTAIDVHLGDIGHGLLESSHLSTINQSELVLGLGTENIRHHSGAAEQPLSATPSPANSLQDEEMDDFKVGVARIELHACIVGAMLTCLLSCFLALSRGVCW